MSNETVNDNQNDESFEQPISEIDNLRVNLEYATRLIWLIVRDLGGQVVISKNSILEATFDEVRVSDTVDGGILVEAVKEEASASEES